MELEVGMVVRWSGHGTNDDRKARVLYIDYPKQEALLEWLPQNGMEVKPYAPVKELKIILGADNKSFLDGQDVTETQNKLRDLINNMSDGENEFQRSACQAVNDLLPLIEHLPVSGPVSKLLGDALVTVLQELGVCK